MEYQIPENVKDLILAIAVVMPLMARVQESIRQSGKPRFLDSTGNLEGFTSL